MFFGEQLQNVRELKGLSRKDLAELVNVSEQAIWQYENQYTVPKFEIVNEFKRIFSVKPQFFYSKPFTKNISTIEHIAYRAEDRESRKKAKMETTYLDFVSHFIFEFEFSVDAPQSSIYSLREASEKLYYNGDSKVTDKKSILQHLAENARSTLDIQNNRDLLYKLEMSGISILEKNMGSHIDAYSTWTKEERPFIILGNIKKSSVRRNFDLAHELGHLLMHRLIDMDSLSKDEHKVIEKEANDFASYFLIPEEEFVEDFKQIKKKSNPYSYVEMKMKYMVSIIALEYRAYKLGLLSYEENRYFYASLNKYKMRQKEPLDEDIPVVKPGKIRALLNFVFENHLLVLNDFLDKYNIELPFLESLLGIDEGFLTKFKATIREDYYGSNVIPLSPSGN
ncbi:helix-turn-helix domain-containing protein [Candidatus Enterococcus ferrettii]|uniref:HTH cro/C1-type domain-containing protein n=1 Tax=Candidatus Enterococcus ferrettii TaxID=2815324 RepID=A0ABV0EWA0_9ENTE|nr:XRE family transcriptional regulator [Enterococcus sp. 665A]MBO1342277.1 XRE family transcriptional regulator [Enterococcus sp. 665A]